MYAGVDSASGESDGSTHASVAVEGGRAPSVLYDDFGSPDPDVLVVRRHGS